MDQQRKPSEFRTIGREVGDKSLGFSQIIFGIIGIVAGIAVIISGSQEGILLIIFGLILIFVGNNKIKKAQTVAWTREALERDRYYSQYNNTPSSINCLSCGSTNPSTSKFCNNCATALQSTCPNCGNPLRPGSKFCNHCGSKIIV